MTREELNALRDWLRGCVADAFLGHVGDLTEPELEQRWNARDRRLEGVMLKGEDDGK